MAILNVPSNGQPSVLLALWRTLKAVGPREKDRLLDLCAPAAIRGEQARYTLRTWSDLGLFVENGGMLDLDSEVAEAVSDPREDPLFVGFRKAALNIVLRDENNSDLGELAAEGGTGAADFTYAVCWMLSQDPHRNWDYALADREQGRLWAGKQEDNRRRPFQNDTRWNGFVDWASFFGLGWTVGTGSGSFFTDPSDAIRARLPDVFGGDPEYPVHTFLARLTSRLPILHNGRYRLRAESNFPEEDQVVAGELSISLSHALLRLASEKEITLLYNPDSPASARLRSKGKGPATRVGKYRSISDIRLGGS